MTNALGVLLHQILYMVLRETLALAVLCGEKLSPHWS
jgi:hypothetical protein